MRCSSRRSKVAAGRRSRGPGNGATTLKRVWPWLAAPARAAPGLQLGKLAAQRLHFLLELAKPDPARIDVFPARCAVSDEAGAVVDRVDGHRPCGDADHRRMRRDVLGDDGIGSDPRAFANLDRPQDLRARPDHHPVAKGRVAFAADPGGRIGPAERDALIDGDVIADLGGLADNAEPVVEEKALAHLGTGMNVDGRQEAREMVDQPGDEIQPPFPQPMRDPVKAERPYAGIEQDVPARARRRIAGLDRIKIGDQPNLHAASSLQR